MPRLRTNLASAVVALAIVLAGCGGDDEPAADRPATTFVPKTSAPPEGPRALNPQPHPGSAREAFAEACGSCHSLRAAGTDAFVGPDLDDLRPSARRVQSAIETGGATNRVMPRNLLVERDARRVARYVARVAGASADAP